MSLEQHAFYGMQKRSAEPDNALRHRLGSISQEQHSALSEMRKKDLFGPQRRIGGIGGDGGGSRRKCHVFRRIVKKGGTKGSRLNGDSMGGKDGSSNVPLAALWPLRR